MNRQFCMNRANKVEQYHSDTVYTPKTGDEAEMCRMWINTHPHLTFMKVCSLRVGWASGRGSHSSLLRNTICMQMIWARRLNRAYNGLPSIITGANFTARVYDQSIKHASCYRLTL